MIGKREFLENERNSITHKFTIYSHEQGEVECYFTVGLYNDGRPGEIFICMAKEGSTLGALMDQLAISISIGLQFGIPLRSYIEKYKHTNFEPKGFTSSDVVRICSSPVDYIARWLEIKFSDFLDGKQVIEAFPEPQDSGPPEGYELSIKTLRGISYSEWNRKDDEKERTDLDDIDDDNSEVSATTSTEEVRDGRNDFESIGCDV